MKTRRLARRTFLKAGAAAAVSLAIDAPVIAQQRVRAMRFGHMLPAETVYHKALLMFAEEVNKNSGGKMKVEVYPSSQLGSIPEMLSQVKVGSLTMSMAVPAWYSNHMKPIDAFTLPFIVGSADKLKVALDGNVGHEINRMGEVAGFHVFGYWLLGGRHIVNKVRPVNVPADCQGLKLRVINSQVYIQAFRALGASTVAMDPAELYVSMQQGVIDGFEYPLPDLLAYKLNEVVKYVSLDNHTTDFFIVSMNKGLWDALSPEEQAIINQSMKVAMDWQWKAQPEDINAALAKLKTLVQVNEITPANKRLFVEATRPVYAQFEGSIGKDFLGLVIKEVG